MTSKNELHSGQNCSAAAKIAVIGAGPAGLAAAYRLQKAGANVVIYEAQPQVGGLCRSLELWHHQLDLGPHRFFSSNQEVNQFWFQAVGTDFSWVMRKTRIFYKQRYFEYPLQALNTFWNLGFFESFLSLASYLKQKFRFFSDQDLNFESWVVHRFGWRLYQIFFKTYSEKLWGLPCDQIDPDFAYRKIRKLSVFEVVKRFFKKKQTFVDYFAYPHGGAGAVYEITAERFQRLGGKLYLEEPVLQIRSEGAKVRLVTNKSNDVFDDVISTMPLTTFIKQLPDVPSPVLQAAESLQFRNTILVYLWIDGANPFPDNWIYVHSPDVEFGRVTNFNNWSKVKKSEATGTVLCLEYWCSFSDSLWKKNDQELSDFAKQELRKSQLLASGTDILDTHVIRLPKSYPVFKVGYQKPLQNVKEYLQRAYPQICSIGRYGAFKYNNQDHSILMGLRAADQILRRAENQTEAVNTNHLYEEDFELSDIRYDQFDEV
jgi:protoporphyrinogen oxidase